MSTTTRRILLTGAAALPAAATLGAVPPDRPDAELIRACGTYIEALMAYDAEGGHLESDEDPLWWAVEDARELLCELEAETMDGVAALARVAKCLAGQPDGTENYSDSFTGMFPQRVVETVLRLSGVVPKA